MAAVLILPVEAILPKAVARPDRLPHHASQAAPAWYDRREVPDEIYKSKNPPTDHWTLEEDMNSAEAKSIAHFLLAEMANEASTTARVFGAVPGGRLDYKPDAASKTALGLLRHITLEDEWLLTAVADGKFVPPPDDSDACGLMTPQDAIARYNEKIPAAMERVKALSGEDLARQIDMLGFMQMPAVNFLALAVKHSVHHRGQLSSYLRAMGGKVPGIYGPSADTPMS